MQILHLQSHTLLWWLSFLSVTSPEHQTSSSSISVISFVFLFVCLFVFKYGYIMSEWLLMRLCKMAVFMFLYLFTSPCSVCDSGKWWCSENFCPVMCVVEGQFVTTYDGKQYSVPSKCTYMVSQVTHFCLNHHLLPTWLDKLTAGLHFFRVTTGGYTLSILKGHPPWRQLLFSFFRYKQSETATVITFNEIPFMKMQKYSFTYFVVICEIPGNVSILT